MASDTTWIPRPVLKDGRGSMVSDEARRISQPAYEQQALLPGVAALLAQLGVSSVDDVDESVARQGKGSR